MPVKFNVAIVHYHLNRGGVTRVIAGQLRALNSALQGDGVCRVAVFYGGRNLDWPHDLADRLERVDLTLCAVPGLEYDIEPVDHSETLATVLRERLVDLDFAPAESLLHVHNHGLGKNLSLPGALCRLAEEGFPLLLQVHDFAEDFRPANYRLLSQTFSEDRLPKLLYPQAEQVHYAVLNSRDESVLGRAGVERARLHFLPNPVAGFDDLPGREHARRKLQQRFGIPRDHRYVLYPVRGIRRKNVGEALLWSLLAGSETTIGLTLAPLDPAERARHDRWKQFAVELELPFVFETGGDDGLTFPENVATADAMLTTSVAEGFGMVFLESWLAGRPLAGRNLPDITADFCREGVNLNGLYGRLNIPIDWVGGEPFTNAIQKAYTKVLESYGRAQISEQQWQTGIDEKIFDGCIDFGDLNERLQEQVIGKVHGDAGALQELLRLNPAVNNSFTTKIQTIQQNRTVIQERYSLAASGRRLRNIYDSVLRSSRDTNLAALNGGSGILDEILNLSRFRLIRADV